MARMSLEELKDELARKLWERDKGKPPDRIDTCEYDPNIIIKGEWEIYLRDANEYIKAFLKFCKENNIYQVVEGELPELPMSFRDYDGYKRCKEDMRKWHKQSLKPISEVLK